MSVQVIVPSGMRCLTDGQRTVYADGSTVRQVLTRLRGDYPALACRLCEEDLSPKPFVKVFAGEDETSDLQGSGYSRP